MSDVVWSADHADLDGYTECAALSYLIVPIEQGTGSSPVQVVFFHGDDYAGTATEPAMGFWPAVEQTDEDTVSVTWRYPEDGDSNANPSGEATSAFSWNDESGEVERDGDLPPYATER
ncbi:LppP/LprE family lipoprotein [Agrococcus casei]